MFATQHHLWHTIALHQLHQPRKANLDEETWKLIEEDLYSATQGEFEDFPDIKEKDLLSWRFLKLIIKPHTILTNHPPYTPCNKPVLCVVHFFFNVKIEKHI